MTGAQAALVGSTALSLIVPGALAFRRRWWAYIGLMWIFTYAVLFLASDAYIVFKFVFLGAAAALGTARLLGGRDKTIPAANP